MAVQINEQGTYERFKTSKGRRVLVLNNERWFGWVTGQKGELLVRSSPSHRKSQTCERGRFYFVQFADDPEYRDVPHLFLETEDGFEELILPNGLPDEQDVQKKVIRTEHKMNREKLEMHLREILGGISAEAAADRALSVRQQEDEPLPGYAGMTVSELRARITEMPAADLELLRRYEASHKNRKMVLQFIDRRKAREAESGGGAEEPPSPAEAPPPVESYEEKSAITLADELAQLSLNELERLDSYERAHKNRKTLLEEIERCQQKKREGEAGEGAGPSQAA